VALCHAAESYCTGTRRKAHEQELELRVVHVSDYSSSSSSKVQGICGYVTVLVHQP